MPRLCGKGRSNMKKSTFNTLLVGGGFLLGTAGIKLLTSAPVKNACVQGIARAVCASRTATRTWSSRPRPMSMTWLPRLPTSPRAKAAADEAAEYAPRHKL
ncbi:MAG: DUF1490 domain-containing protein [Collinsella sp.]